MKVKKGRKLVNYSLISILVFSSLLLGGCAISLKDEPFIIGPALERRSAKIQAETISGQQILLSGKMKDIDTFGKWMVFSMDFEGSEEIFVMKKNGTKLRRLTFNDCYDGKPKWFHHISYNWLPKIIFCSNRDRKYCWYIIKPNGKELERVYSMPSLDKLDKKKWLFTWEKRLYITYFNGSIGEGYPVNKYISNYYWTKDGHIICTTGFGKRTKYYKCSVAGDGDFYVGHERDMITKEKYLILREESINLLKEEYRRLEKEYNKRK